MVMFGLNMVLLGLEQNLCSVALGQVNTNPLQTKWLRPTLLLGMMGIVSA